MRMRSRGVPRCVHSALVPDVQTLFDCGAARFTYREHMGLQAGANRVENARNLRWWLEPALRFLGMKRVWSVADDVEWVSDGSNAYLV